MTDSIRTHTDQAGFLTLKPEPWVAEASCASSGHPDAWFPEKGTENTWRDSRGYRFCRTCARANQKRIRDRQSEGLK